MKLSPLLGVLAIFAVTGCTSQGSNSHDHWNSESIGPSMGRAFLSYDVEDDGNYIDFQYEKKRSIKLTMKRYFFNDNPENPFQEEDKDFYAPRPPLCLVPRVWDYIHLEGLAMGALIYASGGAFIPIPLDSVLGTFSPGGDEEWSRGMHETFSTTEPAHTASFLHESIGLEPKTN